MSSRQNFNVISLKWALAAMAIALIIAIAMDRIFGISHSKPIFLGIFVIAFVGKTFANHLKDLRILSILTVVGLLHVFTVFLSPDDSSYPGAVLLPLGLLEISALYVILNKVAHAESD